ncbi:head completion/stabilization protein [Pseudoalteromonas luteoviolacea]|uniref:Phage head protein n=1 Tax=Pseudoalteromonas luteoviolacea S4060-1 TaxID=1365257 RepID=A0A167JRD5_9GAMM|nr:head completion/stabilization protein [Pseudoalteromonas luteoviolacea]KZN61551.1 hypothetical protein N478_05640 [Pseudoalteromonas luteoviolacea S4060-1]
MNISGMPLADQTVNDVVLPGEGYYPSLSTAEFTRDYNVATEYANKPDMLKSKLTFARAEVEQQLQHNRLTVNQSLEAQQVMFYRHAVYSKAKAALLISKLDSTHRDKASQQQLAANENKEHWDWESLNAVRLLVALTPNLRVSLL